MRLDVSMSSAARRHRMTFKRCARAWRHHLKKMRDASTGTKKAPKEDYKGLML
jgi:hypothetical protein